MIINTPVSAVNPLFRDCFPCDGTQPRIVHATEKGGINISRMSRLMIKTFGLAGEDICELEQARYFLNFDDRIILVEGQRVKSWEELVQVAGQDKNRDKEYLEVVSLPTIMGG
jgi:hypothetical protein